MKKNNLKPVARKLFSSLSDRLRMEDFHFAGHTPIKMEFADVSRAKEARGSIISKLGQKFGFTLRYNKPDDITITDREQKSRTIKISHVNVGKGQSIDGLFKTIKRKVKGVFDDEHPIYIRKLITKNLATDQVCVWTVVKIIIDNKNEHRLQLTEVDSVSIENIPADVAEDIASGMMETVCKSEPAKSYYTVCSLVAERRGYNK